MLPYKQLIKLIFFGDMASYLVFILHRYEIIFYEVREQVRIKLMK